MNNKVEFGNTNTSSVRVTFHLTGKEWEAKYKSIYIDIK